MVNNLLQAGDIITDLELMWYLKAKSSQFVSGDFIEAQNPVASVTCDSVDFNSSAAERGNKYLETLGISTRIEYVSGYASGVQLLWKIVTP